MKPVPCYKPLSRRVGGDLIEPSLGCTLFSDITRSRLKQTKAKLSRNRFHKPNLVMEPSHASGQDGGHHMGDDRVQVRERKAQQTRFLECLRPKSQNFIRDRHTPLR